MKVICLCFYIYLNQYMYIFLNCDISCLCRYQDLDNKYFVKLNFDFVYLESVMCLVFFVYFELWFKYSLINVFFGYVVISFVFIFFC